MKDIYITQNGTLERKDNSIRFKNEKISKVIPVQAMGSVYCFAEVSLNSKLFSFLSQMQIPVYFYNYYGFYTGVFAPKQEMVSGNLLIKQVDIYRDTEKRLQIAKEIVSGSYHNITKTLYQYRLEKQIRNIDKYEQMIKECEDINNLMLIEANIKQYYYQCFNLILSNKDFEFIQRVKQPPDNFINTLISFGNSLLYATTLSEIFKTQLNPLISFLHEPFERRYSLNLDIADIFKPLIVDRVIFTLINKNIIKPEHFDKELNFCYLSEDGRKLFMREYDAKLSQSLIYPGLKRKVSYRYMLRLECYKLIRHILEGEKYKSFKIYW